MNKLSAALLASSTLVLAASTAFAGSWLDDDYGASTSAPSYYERNSQTSDSAPSPRRQTSSARRKNVISQDVTPFSPGSNNVDLSIGQVFLIGDTGGADNAIGLKGNYTYGVSRLFAFEAGLGHSSHSEGRYSLWSMNGGMRLNLSNVDKIIPYTDAGIGFYKPSRSLANSNASYSDTLFGVYLGAGVDLLLSQNMFFGANLALNNTFSSTKETTSGEIDLGGSAINFMAKVGYSF